PHNEDEKIAAAAWFMCEHDVTSFAAVDPERDTAEVNNARRIFCSQWRREGVELIYEIRGNGFLHHMVRNLVGTFILIGKGSLKATDVPRILEAGDRSAAGATAPASSLYLVSVEY